MMEYLTSAVIQSPYSFLNENHVKLEMFALDVIDVDWMWTGELLSFCKLLELHMWLFHIDHN